MWTRRAVSTLLTAGLASPSWARAPSRTPDSARADEARAVQAFAEKTHPRGYEAARDADWRARWSELVAAAPTMADGGYTVALRRALAWFADGHTNVRLRPERSGMTLPAGFELFEDGLYVARSTAAHRAMQGRRITALGGVPVAETIRRHGAAWGGNMAWAHRWASNVLSSADNLEGLGLMTDGRLRVGLQDGEEMVLQSVSEPELVEIDRSPSEVERWTQEAGRTSFVRPLHDGRVLLIVMNAMQENEAGDFLAFTRDAMARLAQPRVERVIIDIRRNGGGDNFLAEPLRKHLERSRFNRPGGLYILAGPRTFSAAQNFANRMERETYAVFIGGPTGGEPNHYGDALRMVGAASGETVMVSSLPWFDSYPMDRRTWIMPDIPVPETFEDWRAGRDPAFAAALDDPTSDQGDDLDPLRVFRWARPSQAVSWTPFWLA